MNKVILVGRLSTDPELRQTQNGVSSCRFNVAVNRPYKNQKGEYEADFISCVAWRQTAEFVSRYFSKGKMICLEGSMRNSTYQDRQYKDVTHYKTDVLVESVEFTGEKREGQQNQYQQPNQYQQQPQYQQPAPAQTMVNQAQQQGVPTQSYGSLSDFEEILSDGDVPF